ncbi:MAG: dienelactone hydrolase family protein [Candidatus Woesearchaeota archaeon]
MKYAILLIALLALMGCTETKDMLDSIGTEVDAESSDYPLEIAAGSVKYYGDVEGYFARPTDQGSYPGVIIIHEWWGLNDNIKDTAEKLAKQGYIVIAIDLYNGKVATTAEEARAQVSSLNQEDALKNMNAAFDFLNNAGATRIGSLGWCFGGGQSMQLAVNNPGIDATIIYYGTLITDKEKLSSIDQPVLGIFGETDTSITVEKVNEFKSALDELQITNEIYIYPNVGHAFANPSGANYAPAETEDAWKKTLTFLEENLKN